MRSRIKFLITLVVLLLVVVTVSVVLYRHGQNKQKKETDGFDRKKEALEILQKAVGPLERLWESGDLEGLWKKGHLSCLKELGNPEGVNDEFLRCNPNFLQCYFDFIEQKKDTTFLILREGQKQPYHVNPVRSYPSISRFGEQKRFYRILTREAGYFRSLPPYLVELQLTAQEFPGLSLRVLLQDTCHDVFLPERTYAEGPMPIKKKDDWRWDTFGRSLYVDKYLVTNRDIAEWMDYSDVPKRLFVKSVHDDRHWALPATGLLPEQMEAYCLFRGKELMEARVFDAATFRILDENPLPQFVQRSPWPWALKKKNSFIDEIRNGKPVKLDRLMCEQAYVQECQTILPWEAYNNWSQTWSGLFNALGGYMEYMKNPRDPEKNLKASSFYFRANSPVHELGRRYFWDGKGFEKNNFRIPGIEDVTFDGTGQLEVAFRCMGNG